MKKFKAPVVKEQPPLERVISCMKKENSYGAIKFMLTQLKPIERAVFVTNLLANSKYRTYKMAMNRFIDLINYVKEDSNQKTLHDFRNALIFDNNDLSMYDFSACRAYIIDDIIHDNYTYSLNAIVFLIVGLQEYSEVESLLGLDSFKEISEKLKPVAADLAFKLYPEAAGLRILFGGNSERKI